MAGNHMGLSDSVLMTQELSPRTASSGTQNGAGVDMKGWEGVVFAINIGAITGDGAFDARLQSDDNSGFNTATNITGTDETGANATAAITQTTTPNTLVLLEAYRPTERYVRCQAEPSANAVLHSVTAIRYKHAGIIPPTQAASQRIMVRQN